MAGIPEEGSLLPPDHITIFRVFCISLSAALASGIGATPLLFASHFSPKWLSYCNAATSGLILAATASLIKESIQDNLVASAIGMLCGVIFMILSKRVLDAYEDVVPWNESLDSATTHKVLLVIAVMTIHSGAEGVGMGVSFGGDTGEMLGLLVNVILAIHNIPEGLAIALVIVPRGISPIKGVMWAIFCSLPQPLVAVPAFIFVEVFESLVPIGLGFAGAAMFWMSFVELIPEALSKTHNKKGVYGVILMTLIVMVVLQEVLLQSLYSHLVDNTLPL